MKSLFVHNRSCSRIAPIWLTMLLLALGCAVGTSDVDTRRDGATDAAMDLGRDGATDAAMDLGMDGVSHVRPEVRLALDGLPVALIDTVRSGTEESALAPRWIYPEEETVIPPNVRGVAWNFTLPSGTDTYVVEFVGRRANGYVLGRTVPLVIPASEWQRLTDALGPSLLRVSVLAFPMSDPSRHGRATRVFRLSGQALRGAVYYWASRGDYAPVAENEDVTNPRGYFRYDFNDVSRSDRATLFLGFNRAGNRCVGCHALSRDGRRFSTSFEMDRYWAVLDVASTANPVMWINGGPTDSSAPGHFSVFSPDGRWLFTTQGNIIRAFDVSTSGTRMVASFTAPNPVSHINVSPIDGATLVYVEDLTGGGGTGVGKGRIVRLHWDVATLQFSMRQVLIEEANASVYYPAISPDGVWLLYNRATSGSSLSNAGAEIWIRRLDGGTPVALARANQGPSLSNSWPRWAPFESDDGEGHRRFFFTYSSVRAYLSVRGRPQLWLSTFDPAAPEGSDGSSPGLWLPMQNPDTNNHAAQWTDVYVPPPG